jgi:hypothetical protein
MHLVDFRILVDHQLVKAESHIKDDNFLSAADGSHVPPDFIVSAYGDNFYFHVCCISWIFGIGAILRVYFPGYRSIVQFRPGRPVLYAAGSYRVNQQDLLVSAAVPARIHRKAGPPAGNDANPSDSAGHQGQVWTLSLLMRAIF